MVELENFRRKHFDLPRLLVAYFSRIFFRNNTYTIRHGLASGMRRKGGLGFLPLHSEDTADTRYLRDLSLAGKVVYDIGAFEGILMLYFATRAKQVIVWEPNPVNYQRAQHNVRLNDLTNVRLLNHGLSNAPGTIDFYYDPLLPGAGSGDDAIKGQIVASVKTARKICITVARLDDEVRKNHLPLPDLIKIDIEGMEFQALEGMQRLLLECCPELYIELHGASRNQKKQTAHAVTTYLETYGYEIYEVESGEYLTSSTLGDRCPAHIHCRRPNRPALA